MRSAVVFVVEHDDTTDHVQAFAEWAELNLGTPMAFPELTLRDYAVRVDLPNWTWFHGAEVLFEREV